MLATRRTPTAGARAESRSPARVHRADRAGALQSPSPEPPVSARRPTPRAVPHADAPSVAPAPRAAPPPTPTAAGYPAPPSRAPGPPPPTTRPVTNPNSNANSGGDIASNLASELLEVKDENARLRAVEAQFWRLLDEREELAKALEECRASGTVAPPSAATGPSFLAEGVAPNGAFTPTAAFDATTAPADATAALHSALKECMDLLLDQECGRVGRGAPHETGGPAAAAALRAAVAPSRGGTVGVFLGWLAAQAHAAARANAGSNGSTVSGSASHFGGSGDASARWSWTAAGAAGAGGDRSDGASAFGVAAAGADRDAAAFARAERAALTAEVDAARRAAAVLREELDRTDLSRLQALDDAAAAQRQAAALAVGVSELRAAYAALRPHAEGFAQAQRDVAALRGMLADRDAELAEARAALAQAARVSGVDGAQLAADAARIRTELATRRSQPRAGLEL